ncbi:MAG TPA: VIT domain-containing protein, partial [Burkholderiaceae bacterium]|nr:VIT domain-containing protein [Burkholderiaceae bacterium]
FDLPAGAVVTGYALDIDGTLVDGVLVEPLKARRAYEDQVREGIDPGLAEVSRANRFTTQVYPFRDRSARTIRVKFSAPMDTKRGLVTRLRRGSTRHGVSFARLESGAAPAA